MKVFTIISMVCICCKTDCPTCFKIHLATVCTLTEGLECLKRAEAYFPIRWNHIAWRILAESASVPGPASIVAELQMDLHGSDLIPFSDDMRQVMAPF